jgi:hypothetical protein
MSTSPRRYQTSHQPRPGPRVRVVPEAVALAATAREWQPALPSRQAPSLTSRWHSRGAL